MTHEQKVQMMKKVKLAVHEIVKQVFEAVDEEIEQYSFKRDDVVLVRSSKVRMGLKSIRKETLDAIKAIATNIEGVEDGE